MTTFDREFPYTSGHPADLLEIYVLGALEESEREVFEDHLDSCLHCARAVADLEQAVSGLAGTVPQAFPPTHLRDSIREAVDQLSIGSVVLPSAANESSLIGTPSSHRSPVRATFNAFAMPLAATLVLGLLTASIIMNVVTTSRLNSLEQGGANTATRLDALERGHASASSGISQLGASGRQTDAALKQIMETNYLMARPFTQPLLLLPTHGGSESEGVLLVANDGRKAILMLANMEPSQPSQTYQVWLARNGQRFPAGQISVDATGWGTMALSPPESLFGFDWMNLTIDTPEPGGSSEMVLQTRILSPGDR